MENVRQSIEQITLFYQMTGELEQVYTIVFSGYSPRRESLIIDYLENTAEYRQLAELKNTFGHLELCLLYTSPSPRDKRQSRMPSSA